MEKESDFSKNVGLSNLDQCTISKLWNEFKAEFNSSYLEMIEFCGSNSSQDDLERAGLLEDKIFWFVVSKINNGNLQLPPNQMRDFFAGNVRFDIVKHAYASEKRFLFKTN